MHSNTAVTVRAYVITTTCTSICNCIHIVRIYNIVFSGSTTCVLGPADSKLWGGAVSVEGRAGVPKASHVTSFAVVHFAYGSGAEKEISFTYSRCQ